MKKLTKEQIKIIYISAVVLVFLIIFWIFVYRPQTRELTSIKQELIQAEAQIAEINRLIGDKELTQAAKELNMDFNKIASQLPSGEEDVIDVLSDKARSLSIEVKNITPSGRQVLEDKIAGYNIEELSVSMKIVCEYKVLGEYLNNLRNNLPVLVRVRQINIKGKGEGRPNLEVALEISAYLSKRN